MRILARLTRGIHAPAAQCISLEYNVTVSVERLRHARNASAHSHRRLLSITLEGYYQYYSAGSAAKMVLADIASTARRRAASFMKHAMIFRGNTGECAAISSCRSHRLSNGLLYPASTFIAACCRAARICLTSERRRCEGQATLSTFGDVCGD